MEHKIKIYLDTSVPNFLFADDAPEKRDITIDFFSNFVKLEKYHTFISAFVLVEIDNTTDLKKKIKLLEALKQYPLTMLQSENRNEIETLAQKYVKAGIIPMKNIFDAYHIAVCTVFGIDYLVSWNFRHLANVNKENLVRIVNCQNNYLNELRIITPLELTGYGT